MKKRIRVTAWMLCIMLVLSWVSFAQAAGGEELHSTAASGREELLYTARLTYRLPMWHYSNGYWIITNGSSRQRVDDKTVDSSGGLQSYLTENYTSFAFSVSLPDQVKNALKEGTVVTARMENRGNAPWTEIFDGESCNESDELSPKADKYSFTLRPVFNLDAQYTYEDFVDGLHNAIPLLHYRFGGNCYSIFTVGDTGSSTEKNTTTDTAKNAAAGTGKNTATGAVKYTAVQADGFFDEGAPSLVNSPYLHPSMIRNKSGVLTDDGVISLNGKTVCTKGLSVGNNTFSQNGAVGIIWTWSFNVSFYRPAEDPLPAAPQGPVDPGDDPAAEEPDEPADPGDEPAAEEPQEPADPDGGAWDLQALLQLPESCYEGQWVTAEDGSGIMRGGEPQQLTAVYTQGLAHNHFRAPDARKGSKTTLSQKLRYDSPGDYIVTLDIEAATGETDSDAKVIEVKPCPAVSASLGGCQKENRKQTLYLEIHQNPGYPVTSLSIELEEPESGERVAITKTLAGSGAKTVGTEPGNTESVGTEPCNTEHIKYRSPALQEGTEDKLCCTLEFLTKFHEDRTLKYRVAVTDSRGNTDCEEGIFSVVKDIPPQVSIGLADRFYREKNSNQAVIEASDQSPGAGRFQRTWKYAADGSDFICAKELPGYKDFSMGTGKSIAFHKEGVGSFQLQLTVKDLWAEETLEEYVTEEDHLQATAEKSAVVDNVAPVVSLKTCKAQTARVLLLADSLQGKQELERKTQQLKALLAAAGVDASIAVDFLRSCQEETQGAISFAGTIPSPFGCQDETVYLNIHHTEGFWNAGHYTADDDAVYVMDSAALVPAEKGSDYKKRTAPFYIQALDGASHAEKWKVSIPEDCFPETENFWKASFGHDVQSRYLYLTAGSRTMILDKACGSVAGMADIGFGFMSYAAGEQLYTFRSDGIWRVSMEDGAAICIRKSALSAGEEELVCFGNTIRFCETDSGGLWLCTFHPDTEGVTRVRLRQSGNASCLGMDTRGYVFVLDGSHTLYAYDEKGTLLAERQLPAKSENFRLSRDASGRANYAAGSYRKKTGSAERGNVRKYNYVTLSGIFSVYEAESYFCSRPGEYYRSYADVELALELADGTVCAIQPCQIVYGEERPAYSYSQYNFYTADGSSDHRILCPTGYPASGVCTTASWRNIMEVYVKYSFSTGLHLRLDESHAAEQERILAKWGGEICISGLNGSENDEELADRILSGIVPAPQPASMTYRAGEVIDYRIFYSDYEGDPSRESFWCYVHQPSGGSIWKNSGKVLSAPVTRFTQCGKYTLTHWQTDSADRGKKGTNGSGNTGTSGSGKTGSYDKASAPVTITFYIVENQPAPEEPQETPAADERSLRGEVEHTAQWEANRQAFNLKYHGISGADVYSVYASYAGTSSPRLRGTNVFWPGESLQLQTRISGEVSSVTAQAVGTGYSTRLSCKEKDPLSGISHYTGVLYDSSMIETLNKDNPREVIIRFRAAYVNGSILTFDVPVIFDYDTGYWMLHRTM